MKTMIDFVKYSSIHEVKNFNKIYTSDENCR